MSAVEEQSATGIRIYLKKLSIDIREKPTTASNKVYAENLQLNREYNVTKYTKGWYYVTEFKGWVKVVDVMLSGNGSGTLPDDKPSTGDKDDDKDLDPEKLIDLINSALSYINGYRISIIIDNVQYNLEAYLRLLNERIKNLSSSGGYDDTDIKNELTAIKNNIGNIKSMQIKDANSLVDAINILNLKFVKNISYLKENKILKITYESDTETDIDIKEIADSIEIGDLGNVSTEDIEDKQTLIYDAASNMFIPGNISLDSTAILDESKKYTDEQLKLINILKPEKVDDKPTVDNTVDGQWYLYKDTDGNIFITTYLNGEEFTISTKSTGNNTDIQIDSINYTDQELENVLNEIIGE